MTGADAGVFLGLGSDLGERERAVLAAVRAVDAAGAGAVIAASSLYESEAVDMGVAPPFINAVIQVQTLLSPEDLLNRLKTIEKRWGRRGGHNAPREIDVDIIAFGETVMDTPRLTLPHPRYAGRAFVLVPLREVAPGFVCPRTGRSIDELVAAAGGGQDVIRVSGRRFIPGTTP